MWAYVHIFGIFIVVSHQVQKHNLFKSEPDEYYPSSPLPPNFENRNDEYPSDEIPGDEGYYEDGGGEYMDAPVNERWSPRNNLRQLRYQADTSVHHNWNNKINDIPLFYMNLVVVQF